MAQINIMTHRVGAPAWDAALLTSWIEQVAHNHGRRVGQLSYLFCDDEHILLTNRQFLQHDYYTDIITFDYSTSRRISGDIVISLDTVRSNALTIGASYASELCRVVIHGVLHLCGIDDKGPGQREVMEQHENEALVICPKALLSDIDYPTPDTES